ncbi:MAG: zinc metallopeptidase [Deltaproteobacteria bacterium]|nr:zinc metallopeptidase [Deltaproteobacteria bacterium]
MFFYFDPLYLLMMLVTLAFSGWATLRVKGTYKHYSQIASQSRYTGGQIAEQILQQQGITDVRVESIGARRSLLGGDGILSDHYDPREKVVRLSPHVYQTASIAAQAIAAHEVGHAVQHATAYAPLRFRNALVPMANFGSQLSYLFIFLGLIIQTFALVKLGIVLFGVAVLFQLVTLPVEFDASARAKQWLMSYGIVGAGDQRGVAAVLNAAAWTYVAAAAAAVLNLLYLLLRTGLFGNSRD